MEEATAARSRLAGVRLFVLLATGNAEGYHGQEEKCDCCPGEAVGVFSQVRPVAGLLEDVAGLHGPGTGGMLAYGAMRNRWSIDSRH